MAKVFLVPRNRLTAGGGSVVVNSVGAITLTPASGQDVTIASGSFTIPDGTAAAPGLRTTTEAHGIYRGSATALGLSVAGDTVLSLERVALNDMRMRLRGGTGWILFTRASDGVSISDVLNVTTEFAANFLGLRGSSGVALYTLSGAVLLVANGSGDGDVKSYRRTAIAPSAVAGGVVALTITQAAHTALTAEVINLNIAAHSLTLTDTTTIALMRNVVLGAPTYVGVAAGGSEIVTTGINLEVALPVQGANLTLTNAPVAIRSMGNMIIGDVLSPAAGPTNTLIIASGTAPTSSPDNSVTLYSSDISAGNTEPSFYCEGTAVIATGQADSASSVRVKMRFNGTEVTVLCI